LNPIFRNCLDCGGKLVFIKREDGRGDLGDGSVELFVDTYVCPKCHPELIPSDALDMKKPIGEQVKDDRSLAGWASIILKKEQ